MDLSNSFGDNDGQVVDRDDHDEGNSMAAIVGAPKRTNAKTSVNSEQEMRQLFIANKHRTLAEVAVELHGNDRGPNSERTRQLFGMLWYA